MLAQRSNSGFLLSGAFLLCYRHTASRHTWVVFPRRWIEAVTSYQLNPRLESRLLTVVAPCLLPATCWSLGCILQHSSLQARPDLDRPNSKRAVAVLAVRGQSLVRVWLRMGLAAIPFFAGKLGIEVCWHRAIACCSGCRSANCLAV